MEEEHLKKITEHLTEWVTEEGRVSWLTITINLVIFIDLFTDIDISLYKKLTKIRKKCIKMEKKHIPIPVESIVRSVIQITEDFLLELFDISKEEGKKFIKTGKDIKEKDDVKTH